MQEQNQRSTQTQRLHGTRSRFLKAFGVFSPRLFPGRVKTLHPAVHGGILARHTPSDEADMVARGYEYIDYVVCNLYMFKKLLKAKVFASFKTTGVSPSSSCCGYT